MSIGGDYRTFIGGNIVLVAPVMRIAPNPGLVLILSGETCTIGPTIMIQE